MDLNEANRIILAGYPYKEGAAINAEALKLSLITRNNGKDFVANETVTTSKLNAHCEALLTAQKGT